ncbi:MAG: hypothetical protein IKF36_04445 [Bacilli bacterium]|nr:hypothetical protein [Bacilli bacterium]
MNNKILVVVYVPFVDEEFDLFIPINKKVGTIKNIIISSIHGFDLATGHVLINEEDSKIVEDNVYVKNSGINNGARLVLI